jgi:surfeit locus 1 family protein
MGAAHDVAQVAREALRKRWWIWNLIVLVAVVGMANLGLWQLRRLDQRRDHNDAVAAGVAAPPVRATELETKVKVEPAADFEWRRVSARGSWRGDEQVLVRNRSLNGLPGVHVVTPLELADGTLLIVNRGFAPVDTPADLLIPPAGEVELTGIIRLSQTRGWIGPTDPATGRLDELARVDVDRLAQQIPEPVIEGLYAELIADPDAAADPDSADSADGANSGQLPTAVGTTDPDLGEGPHLNYALQWFAFCIVTLIAYWAILRRSLRTPRPHKTAPAS